MGFYSTEGVAVTVQAGTRYVLCWENGYALRGVPFMHCDRGFFFFFCVGISNSSLLVYGPSLCVMRVFVTLRIRHNHDQFVCILS
jgi:hypothetical protein